MPVPLKNMTFFSRCCLSSTLPEVFLQDTLKKMDPFQPKMSCCLSAAVTPPSGEVTLQLIGLASTHSLIYTNVIPFIDLHKGNSFFICLPVSRDISMQSQRQHSHFYQKGFTVRGDFLKDTWAYELLLIWGREPSLITVKSRSLQEWNCLISHWLHVWN